ncbi:DUF5723 family protein [Arundinibacter roseus]|uniref:DUF5723 domain-containing protein n=1 Tax=Arundinibacter roseus TaxID=2070510 RepID=A0A4R4KN44_9BACT|nr:DUF5723 family protein [Arundinibacter roseus]TDB68139.1 hypothetical protein EZE20_04240 [Arundinibacter roseus]
MNRTLLILIWLLATGLHTALAQHMPGVAMGNYAGTQALYHNPAFVADSRYAFYINGIGSQTYIANSHIKYNAPYSFLSLLTNNVPDQYRNEKGAIILPRADLEQRLNGRLKHLNLGAEARLPSVMFSLRDGKIGIGLSSRVRAILNTTETTESLAQALRSRGKAPEIQSIIFENQATTLHLNGVGELALTLGGVVMDNEADFLKVGFTVKRVLGLYNAHVVADNSSFGVFPDENYNNLREIIEVPVLNAQYGYTSEGAFQNFTPNPAWLLGNAPAGSGWGFDVGMVYEYRPNVHKYSYTEKGQRKRDGSKNKYLYRMAVSLTDVGRINYKNPNYVNVQQVNVINRSFRYERFQNLQGTDGFFNAVDQSLGVTSATRTTSFRSVLPTTFQASLDYMVKPNVYINTLWVQNLRGAGAFGMKGESILSVTPRYEHRWYELSVPVSIMNQYGSFGIGLAGRAGPLWIGTDHLAGLLNIGKPKMVNLYAGLSMGLYRRPPSSPNPCYLEDREPFFRRIFRRR